MTALAAACCLVLFGGEAAAAQDDGSIWGIVDDELGGLLPGVTATARHSATGLARSAVTGDFGIYEIARLPPGDYEVTPVLPGFRADPAAATVAGTQVLVDFTLSIAPLAETVTVTRTGQGLDDVPNAVAVLGPEALGFTERKASLDEALRGVPGLTVQSRRDYGLTGGIALSVRTPPSKPNLGIRGRLATVAPFDETCANFGSLPRSRTRIPPEPTGAPGRGARTASSLLPDASRSGCSAPSDTGTVPVVPAREPAGNPGPAPGQGPPSVALLISPPIASTSRLTDIDTRSRRPVVVHVSKLKYSAASITPSPPTTSWTRVATAQESVPRTGRTSADTSRVTSTTTGGPRTTALYPCRRRALSASAARTPTSTTQISSSGRAEMSLVTWTTSACAATSNPGK